MSEGRAPAAGAGMSRLRAATSTLAGAAIMITLVTIASRLVGFGRSLVQLGAVGTAGVGSAYTSANVLPNILFEVAAGGALAGSVVPLLAAPIARRARAEISGIASAMLGWTLAALVPLAALLVVAAPPIASVIMARHPDLAPTMTTFLRIFAVQVPLYGVAVVFGGILQAHKRFFWQAFAPLLSSLTLIGVYIAFAHLAEGNQADVGLLAPGSVQWLAWGTTAGVAMLALPLVVPVRRTGTRLRPTLRFPGGEGTRARNLAFAGIGVLIGQQLSVLAAMGAAYLFGPEQTFPTYFSAQQLYLLPYAVLAFPLATSAFPRLAEHVARERPDAFRSLLATTTRALLVVATVGVAALIAASGPAEALFAEVARGSVRGLGPAVAAMAPGIVGYALILHLSRALYTIDRQRAAVASASIGWLTVAAACFALPAAFGARSQPAVLLLLGLATTIGMTVAGAGLLLAVRRHAGTAALRGVPRTLVVAGVSAGVGAPLGALVGRALLPADASAAAAIGAALAAGLIAGAITLAGSWLADRTALTGLLRRGGAPLPEGSPSTGR